MTSAPCSSETTGPPRWIVGGEHTAWHRRPRPGAASPATAEGVLVSLDPLRPRDHAEAVALFRAEVVGGLARRELMRGELIDALRALSKLRVRPPGARTTRCIAVATLARWYYA